MTLFYKVKAYQYYVKSKTVNDIKNILFCYAYHTIAL